MATDKHRILSPAARATRYLAAAIVVAAGIVHLQQYYGVYFRVVPLIGPLFIVDFVLSMLLALALVLPIHRLSRVLSSLVAIGGMLFMAGAIAGLMMAETGTLLGFHEHGYRLAVVLALVFESSTIVLLGLSLMLQRRSSARSTPSGAGYPDGTAGATRPGSHSHASENAAPRA